MAEVGGSRSNLMGAPFTAPTRPEERGNSTEDTKDTENQKRPEDKSNAGHELITASKQPPTTGPPRLRKHKTRDPAEVKASPRPNSRRHTRTSNGLKSIGGKQDEPNPVGSKASEATQVETPQEIKRNASFDEGVTKWKPQRVISGRVISRVEPGRAVEPSGVKVRGNADRTGTPHQRLQSSGRRTTFGQSTTANS